MKLQVIVGSTRPGRASDKVVPWVAALHNARAAGELVPGKMRARMAATAGSAAAPAR